MGENLGLEKASGHPAPAASFTSCSRFRTAAGNFSCCTNTNTTWPDVSRLDCHMKPVKIIETMKFSLAFIAFGHWQEGRF